MRFSKDVTMILNHNLLWKTKKKKNLSQSNGAFGEHLSKCVKIRLRKIVKNDFYWQSSVPNFEPYNTNAVWSIFYIITCQWRGWRGSLRDWFFFISQESKRITDSLATKYSVLCVMKFDEMSALSMLSLTFLR